MSNSQPEQKPLQGDELGKLISLHIDSRITEEQFSQLQYTLEVDESARDFYIEFLSTHARLEQSLKNTYSIKSQNQLSDRELLNELVSATSRPARRFYFLSMGVMVALVVVICFVILTQAPPGYATVTNADQAQTQDLVPLSVGSQLKTQVPYTLEQGQLELLFVSGTKVLITSPATFEISGKNEIRITEGKLVAKVISPSGKGFTVQTPEGAVIDLGTLFGVEIEPSRDSGVQVFQGKIELHDLQGRKTVLPAGKVMRCAAGRKQWEPAEKLSRQFYAVLQEKKQTLLPGMEMIDDSRQSVFGMDEFQGTRYLLYSAIPLQQRLGASENQLPEWDGVAKHFLIVHFDESIQRWRLQGNERALPFEPDSTDVLLARIEDADADGSSDKKKITYFSQAFDSIHGIASGYQASDLKVFPDLFENVENSGDYTIKGSYLIRTTD
jgi:ferric-dicitrate binding protein FerR (iron transport regulator)